MDQQDLLSKKIKDHRERELMVWQLGDSKPFRALWNLILNTFSYDKFVPTVAAVLLIMGMMVISYADFYSSTERQKIYKAVGQSEDWMFQGPGR
jgi:hypothetical protein